MRWFIVILLLLVLSGCVAVSYNPKTGEAKYVRFGDQKLSGILVETPDGTNIIIEAQESEAKLMTDALSVMLKAYEAGRTAP